MQENILFGEQLYEKKKALREIKADNLRWEIFYLDEGTGEKWIEEYPNSELQGGGIPQLRKVANFPWEQE